jgi:DNA-binding NarL/FixJ family response regulator
MKHKILIVDDHTDFRTMLKDYLMRSRLDIEIFEASSAEMAVAKASCVKPDVVLMDISLPKATGLDATKLIKEEMPDCHVIIITMFNVKAFKQAAEGINATAFISKSAVCEQLLPVLTKCLNGKKIKLEVKK